MQITLAGRSQVPQVQEQAQAGWIAKHFVNQMLLNTLHGWDLLMQQISGTLVGAEMLRLGLAPQLLVDGCLEKLLDVVMSTKKERNLKISTHCFSFLHPM